MSSIIIFPTYSQFWGIWKPNSGWMVSNFHILFNSNILSAENWKQNYKISNTALTLLLWVKVLFWPKITVIFCKKNTDTSKVKEALIVKGIFSETSYQCVLRPGWGVILLPSPLSSQNEPIKSPPRLGLRLFRIIRAVFPILRWRLTYFSLMNSSKLLKYYGW